MWGATKRLLLPANCKQISIHAPRVGSDRQDDVLGGGKSHFNPRSPCGERQYCGAIRDGQKYFNPRSPCGERHYVKDADGIRLLFQSTLPVWGATRHACACSHVRRISIHAPRVGSDQPCGALAARISHFNPRSPCGERPTLYRYLPVYRVFQSTLPVWGATRSPTT